MGTITQIYKKSYKRRS